MRAIVVSICLLALAGCASTGVKVDPQIVSSFQIGKTTHSDVVARLGEPSTDTVSANGQRTIVYTYAEAKATPESYIPIVGLFIRGVDTKSQSVALVFDKAGVLADYATANAQNGINTGLVSGYSAPDAKPATTAPKTVGAVGRAGAAAGVNASVQPGASMKPVE